MAKARDLFRIRLPATRMPSIARTTSPVTIDELLPSLAKLWENGFSDQDTHRAAEIGTLACLLSRTQLTVDRRLRQWRSGFDGIGMVAEADAEST
jgi:hypothetical protein